MPRDARPPPQGRPSISSYCIITSNLKAITTCLLHHCCVITTSLLHHYYIVITVTKSFFFWRFDQFFLELDRRDASSPVPTYNYRKVLERSCANDDVITQITSAIVDNYIPIEQLTFQLAAPHRPTSLGRAGLKIATLGTG